MASLPVAPRKPGAIESSAIPSFLFILSLSLSSGTGREKEKEKEERGKRKDSGGDTTLSYPPRKPSHEIRL
jgi:hypothetical protein